jgi:hypothetical protein
MERCHATAYSMMHGHCTEMYVNLSQWCSQPHQYHPATRWFLRSTHSVEKIISVWLYMPPRLSAAVTLP